VLIRKRLIDGEEMKGGSEGRKEKDVTGKARNEETQ
jgi:hypothetical protein